MQTEESNINTVGAAHIGHDGVGLQKRTMCARIKNTLIATLLASANSGGKKTPPGQQSQFVEDLINVTHSVQSLPKQVLVLLGYRVLKSLQQLAVSTRQVRISAMK
jgi:hypothetical protein